MTMTQQTLVTRFNLTQITGNQIVDWSVVDGNYQALGNFAAHIGAVGAPVSNSFTGNQLVAGNVGITGIHRRLTLPVPAANETDRLMLQAEGNSANGTYVGVCAPTAAPAGQRRATLVLHGVEPTGTTSPLGLTLTVDEDNHRTSLNATGTYQDLTAPVLQLGSAGIDRVTIPGTGAVGVVGALTMTGNLLAASAGFSGTLTQTGAALFSSTVTIAGQTQLNGALDLVGNAVFHSSLSVATITSSSVTLSGNLIVTGTITSSGGGSSVTVTGPATFSTLTITGASTFGGVLQLAGGAAYIQSYGGDNSYVQISKLTVTPGTTALAGLTVNGPTQINGTFNVSQGAGFASSVDHANNAVYRVITYYGLNNSTYITNDGTNWTASNSFTASGNLISGGVVQSNSQVFTTPGGSLYLRGADGNVHIDTGAATLVVVGRIIAGNWDSGQSMSVGGHVLASGYIFNRGSTAYRCWDNADFTYTPSNVGNTLVQRDGGGNISVGQCAATQFWNYGPTYYFSNNGSIYWNWDGGHITTAQPVSCGGLLSNGDMIVTTTFYVQWAGATTFQVAAPSGEVFCNSDCHFANVRGFFQVCAYNSYNGGANRNAFLAPNVGNYQGQGLAQSWQTYSSSRWKQDVRTMGDGVETIKKLRPVHYTHEGYGENIGLIAEEVHEVFPQIVGKNAAGEVDSIDYTRLVAPLLAGLLEVIDRLEQTEGGVTRLFDEVEGLRTKLAAQGKEAA